MILANSRLPKELSRDLRAQIGGCVVGERRLCSLMEKYGVKLLNRHIETILASTEERTRRAITRIPPGTYEASSDTKNDGLSDRSYTARMKAIVEGDHITFDFTGTDPQSPGYINGVFSTSFSATISVFSMCLDPDLPHNEGTVKPIEVIIPSGTFLNANYPAATVLGNFTCNNVIHGCVLKSLSKAIPDKVTSGWHRIHGMINTGIGSSQLPRLLYDQLRNHERRLRCHDGQRWPERFGYHYYAKS